MDIKAVFAPMMKTKAKQPKKHYRFNQEAQQWEESPRKPVSPTPEAPKTKAVVKRRMRIEELVVGEPCKKCNGHGYLRNYDNGICFVCSTNRVIRQCDVANFRNRERRGLPTYIYETA